MTDCDMFFPGSRQREICEGLSNLPLQYVNKFRKRHGLPEFEDTGISGDASTQASSVPIVRLRPLKNGDTPKNQGCCGNSREVTSIVELIGDGPGTELVSMLKSVGFTTCVDCIILANKMNTWGVAGCTDHLDEIVADILPRALAWERAKLKWISALVPTGVSIATIRFLVQSAIEHSKKKTSSLVQVLAQPEVMMSTVIGARKKVNEVSGTSKPLCTLPLDDVNVIKHFLYHILPLGGEHEWALLKNIQQVCEGLHQFNGKKIIAIATPESGNTKEYRLPDFVMSEFKQRGHNDVEYIIVQNKRALREVTSFTSLLSRIYSTSPNEVVFYGHCKGVTHASTDSVCHAWADAMYETVYNNWEGAKVALEKYGIAGSFKKYGMFKTPRNHRWHYSGTFYWFRSASVFVRNWQYVDRLFFGTESWPGLMFRQEEAACLFYDNTGDLYKVSVEHINEKLQEWKLSKNASTCTI